MTAVQGPIHFKPMKGCLSIGQKLFDAFGLGGLWEGNDGFEGVTPRQMAEASGFIGRKRSHRRLKAK
jgi:hypothetical protein